MRNSYLIVSITVGLLFVSSLLAQTPLGKGFTYQAEIQQNGVRVDGTTHLRFSLWDAEQGGNQIGADQLVPEVPVVDGVFSVILNASGEFGPMPFNGESRWLQIEVCADAGCTSLSVLNPRQPITGAPYAFSTSWNGLSGVPDGFADGVDDIGEEPWETNGMNIFRATGNVGVGTATPVAKLDVRGGAMLVENIGDQADLLWLAGERSWVFRQEGTGATTALKLQSMGGGGNKNFIIQTDGAVGIGATAPAAKLDVRGDIALGPSGQFRATSGEENLRIVRGTINTDGTIIDGSGFTVTNLEAGACRIDFNVPFAARPTVTATLLEHLDLGAAFDLGTNSVSFLIPDFQNEQLCFIAVGPR